MIPYDAISPVVPVGAIIAYGGIVDDAQDAATLFSLGWMRCDGSELLSRDFAELTAVIGTTYGGSGDTFALPDCRGMTLPNGQPVNYLIRYTIVKLPQNN